MARYLICMKQNGEGCDYTIGCGMRFEFMDYDGSPQDLENEIGRGIAAGESSVEINGHYFPIGDDPSLKTLLIVPAGELHSVNLSKLKRIKQQVDQERTRSSEEAAARAQYEALRARFENRT